MLVDCVCSIKFLQILNCEVQESMDEPTMTTYDRMMSGFKGLPDVIEAKPATMRNTPTMIGRSQTFIVQTMRQREVGDHIFIEIVDATGATRVVLPPKVADCIARQREAITSRVRSKTAKRLADERMARGEKPGFMVGKSQKK